MTRTTRHALLAAGWFMGYPTLGLAVVLSGAVPHGSLQGTLLSLPWGLGLVAIFASWAFRDAPEHGKSLALAVGFTAAWFLLFVLAVIPYLFATRGLKRGLLASGRFLVFCLACLLGWMAVNWLLARLLDGLPSLFGTG